MLLLFQNPSHCIARTLSSITKSWSRDWQSLERMGIANCWRWQLRICVRLILSIGPVVQRYCSGCCRMKRPLWTWKIFRLRGCLRRWGWWGKNNLAWQEALWIQSPKIHNLLPPSSTLHLSTIPTLGQSSRPSLNNQFSSPITLLKLPYSNLLQWSLIL